MKNLKQNSQTQTMFLKIEQQFGRLEKARRRCRQESLIILLRTCQHHDHNAVKKKKEKLSTVMPKSTNVISWWGRSYLDGFVVIAAWLNTSIIEELLCCFQSFIENSIEESFFFSSFHLIVHF